MQNPRRGDATSLFNQLSKEMASIAKSMRARPLGQLVVEPSAVPNVYVPPPHHKTLPPEEPAVDEEGFTVVKRSKSAKQKEREQGKRIKVKARITPEKLKVLIQIMNHYWKALTGKDFDFRFDERSQPYISPPLHTIIRNKYVQTFLDERPDVLEIGCGVGGEVLPTLFMMNCRSITGLEPAFEEFEGRDAFHFLEHNVKHLLELYPQLSSVIINLVQKTAAHYFQSIPPGRHWHFSSLDPPFFLGEYKEDSKEGLEADLVQCVEWAFHEVLVPMVTNGHTCSMFCLKSRYPGMAVKREWDRQAEAYRLETGNDQLSNMVFDEALGACPYKANVDWQAVARGEATRGVIFFVLFSFLEDKIKALRNSAFWNAVVVDHDQDVYVRHDAVMHPDTSFDYSRQYGNLPFQYDPLPPSEGFKIPRIPNYYLDQKHYPKGANREHEEMDKLPQAYKDQGKYERLRLRDERQRGQVLPRQRLVPHRNPYEPLHHAKQ